MSGQRLSVLVVAANASTRWAEEAILPLHIFRGLRKAGHDAWMCVGNETKPELDELLGADAQRVLCGRCPDAFGFSMDSTPRSLTDGLQPALLHSGARHTVAAARRRGATRSTNANFAQGAQPPRRPSCSAGHRTDERRDGISTRLSLFAAERPARSEEPCPRLGKRSAMPCRREASS
jgi:hypothetical protein